MRTLTLIAAAVALLSAPSPAFSQAGPAETVESLKAKAKAAADHARLDGEVALPGLKEPVEVIRDRWGIPHIYAKNQDDLFFAQGFIAAQDRLFQIDMWRRAGVGETAEVLGEAGLEGDRFARLVKYRGDMKAEWASYSPDAERIATAFTAGINAYIDHAGDRLPVEFAILNFKPRKWKPEDCLGRMSGIIMVRNHTSEIARAELIAAVGLEKARRLAPTDPVRAFAPARGLDLAGIDADILAGLKAATRPFPFKLGSDGSNNWAIDGSLSASGKPMLASDPHRTTALPSLRYLAHLNAPGWNVIGSGEPGLPGIALGHNEQIAWGFTIVGTDQADLYVEDTDPADSTRCRVGNGWEKMTVVREKVAVRGRAEPAELDLRFTRHGPVIHQDAKRHRAYALRWVGSEPGAAAYLGSLAVARAGNQTEFVRALKSWKVPGLNMVYADRAGHIGWVAAALTPIRKGWDGLLPAHGAAGEYEWQGFLDVTDLPQTFDPPRRWVATANHNILPDGYAREIAYEWAPPFRFERIRERLGAKAKFDVDDFRSMQHDNTSLPGRRLAKLCRERAAPADRDLAAAWKLIAAWNGELSISSKAGPIYAAWMHELMREFFRPHVPARLIEFVQAHGGMELVLSALETRDPAWFPAPAEASCTRFMESTLSAAMGRLRSHPGADGVGAAAGLRWGDIHTATFRHPLAALGPAYEKAFNVGPVPRGGDAQTPNNTRHDDGFRQIHGASYRHIFDLADWDRGIATSTPGQSGRPGSPHYDDLLPLWARGEYFPLAFSRAKVEEVAKHRLMLKPG